MHRLALSFLVFTGRIHLYKTSLADKAWEYFQLAHNLAPACGLTQAAFANYHQSRNEPDLALTCAQDATELAPDLPDGFVARGLWAESQERWPEANEFL